MFGGTLDALLATYPAYGIYSAAAMDTGLTSTSFPGFNLKP